MTIIQASEKHQFIKYTGSNSTEIITALNTFQANTWEVDTEVGGVLTIDIVGNPGNEVVISTGDYVKHPLSSTNPLSVEVFTPAEFTEMFFQVIVSAGWATVPSLLTTQSATVEVTLKIPFFDTNYSAIGLISGGLTLLGSLQVNSVTVVDEDTVNVVVQNIGLLTLSGASLLVVAMHN